MKPKPGQEDDKENWLLFKERDDAARAGRGSRDHAVGARQRQDRTLDRTDRRRRRRRLDRRRRAASGARCAATAAPGTRAGPGGGSRRPRPGLPARRPPRAAPRARRAPARHPRAGRARRRRLAPRDQARRLPRAVPPRGRRGEAVHAARAPTGRATSPRSSAPSRACRPGAPCSTARSSTSSRTGAPASSGWPALCRAAPTRRSASSTSCSTCCTSTASTSSARRWNVARSCCARCLPAFVPTSACATSSTSRARGAQFFDQACKLSLEGSIAKRRDAPYRSGRGRDWLKVKCMQRQEFVIGGFTERENHTDGIGALLLGYHEEVAGPLHYAGRVGTGWDEKTMRELRGRLDERRLDEPRVRRRPARPRRTRRALGQARAGGRGRVPDLERPRHAPAPVLRGPAPRQAGRRGRARASRPRRPGAVRRADARPR